MSIPGPLTIESGTEYHYVAWVEIGGTWYPGAVLTVTTDAEMPTLTSIAPDTGPTTGGTSVTITGTNLTGATTVMFGANPATGVVVNSDTSVTALSPAGSAGIVDVTVTTAAGTTTVVSAGEFTYEAPIPSAPVLSDINSSVTSSSTATITWTTDVPASSHVDYGTTSGYGISAHSDTATTSHSVLLTDLMASTTYHFAVSSGNMIGTTTSSDQTFMTTGSTATGTPLEVVSITPVNTSATANGEFASGWSWIMRLNVPDGEDAFRMSFTDWSGTAGTFEGGGNVRISSPESSNASTPSNGLVSPADNGYSGWMYLTGDANTLAAGRQIDVTIEVRIPTGTAAGNYSADFAGNSVPQAATSTTP